MTPDLPFRVRLAYALPAFVIAVPIIPVYINLPTFYGVELGLGLAVTGLIMLLARLFDTISDPLIGIASDRYRWRGWRRKPMIALGAVLAGIALFQLLVPGPEVTASRFMLWSVLLYTGWTMVAIPYLAWGAELSGDYHQRARLTGWREGAGLLGILGAGALMAATGEAGWSTSDANAALAWMTVTMGLLAFGLLLVLVPEARSIRATPGAAWQHLKLQTLLDNGLFLRLLAGWFINGLANGLPATLFLLYLNHGLGAPQAMQGLLILVYFAAAVGGIPLWLWLGRRYGKHRAWSLAMIAACLAFVTVPLIPIGGFYWFAAVCLITGMALGADMAIPPAIQADVVDVDTLRHGLPRAGLFFALWSMATKLALAVAVGLALPGLDWFGFDPENVTSKGRTVLLVIYALAPVVLKTIAIVLMWQFPLTQRKHEVVQRRLQRRPENAGLK